MTKNLRQQLTSWFSLSYVYIHTPIYKEKHFSFFGRGKFCLLYNTLLEQSEIVFQYLGDEGNIQFYTYKAVIYI